MGIELNSPAPLPANLPIPQDDGACRHLAGMDAPDIDLPTTNNRLINFRAEASTPTVVFFYPRTGEPGSSSPTDWDMIPGARGCHHHFCGFRNIHREFQEAGFKIFAASSQGIAYQQEFVQRMHVPFEVISDAEFRLTETLRLPTFAYHAVRYIARLTMILNRGKITHVFYPVFPPDRNADIVLAWIRAQPTPSI